MGTQDAFLLVAIAHYIKRIAKRAAMAPPQLRMA
jgi:hypothetical protein